MKRRYSLWMMGLIGLAFCLQLALAGNTKTIIFRDDDASAYFSVPLLEFITDTLITNSIPQTIAVIPANTYGETLANDPLVVAYLKSIKANPKVELALHGYQHTENEFATLTLSQAQTKLVSGLAILNKVLGVTLTTFIPPYNAFNTNTLIACKNKGFTRFSAASYNDFNAFAEAPAGLLHMPGTVDFQDWDNGGVFKSSAAIIQEAQHSLDVNDIVVFTIHFWSFGDDNETLIPANYQTLLNVIGWTLQKQNGGAALMTIGQFTRTKVIGLGGGLAFDNVTVGLTATNTLTITNSGNTTLTVSSITYPSGFNGAWNGTIVGGSLQKVQVVFAPIAVKTYSGTVKVNSDANSGLATLAISGAGIAVVKPVNPTKVIGLGGNLSFGNVSIGSATTNTLTITNSGNTVLTVSSITYPSGFSGAWSGALVAGASCNVPVTFKPIAVKTYGGTVTVNSDKTSGTATLAVSGAGVAAVVPKLLQMTVKVSSDDAYEANGQMNTATLMAVAGLDGTNTYRAGYRFASVALPKNAKVTSAYLSLAYNWSSASQVNTLLYGEAVDSSLTFGSMVSNISSRVRTASNVLWSMPTLSWGQTLASPDLTAIVQEIVSRPQWLSGNPITIIQYEGGTMDGEWEAISLEGIAGTSRSAPVLVINYTQ